MKSEEKKMKYGYARVSKHEQNLNLQKDALQKFGCDHIVEECISGIKNKSTLDVLLKVLQDGDSLVIWKLDRLGRNTSELLELFSEFKSHNINLISLQEHIDIKTPFGKIIYTLLASMAELEREIIIERTKAGLLAARERGNIGGRPKIETSTENLIIQLYTYRQDISVKELIRITGVSRQTVYNCLHRNEIQLKSQTRNSDKAD